MPKENDTNLYTNPTPSSDIIEENGKKGKSSALVIGIGIGTIIIILCLILCVKSFQNKPSARPKTNHAQAEEAKRLNDEINQTITAASKLRDSIYTSPVEQEEIVGGTLAKKLPKAASENLDVLFGNNRGKEEEEAINAVLRNTTTVQNRVPTEISSQLPPANERNAENPSGSSPVSMFTYSKTFGGARYTDNAAKARTPTLNEHEKELKKIEQEALREEMDQLRTLIQLMAVNPELASNAVVQDFLGAKEETKPSNNEMTNLIYTNHPPVIINEGEMFEAVLVNRLIVNVEPAPVVATLSRDVYDRSGKYVVFPANSRVIGQSQAVNYKGASRLFVSFHRIILPNGISVDLPRSNSFMKAMDAQGSLGVVSKVNRHWWLQFGSAIMFGVIDGLAGWAQGDNQSMVVSADGRIISRTSENFDKVLDRMMQQYSSIMPTITVYQGKTMRIYISDDMLISPWQELKERSYFGKRSTK